MPEKKNHLLKRLKCKHGTCKKKVAASLTLTCAYFHASGADS